MTYGLEDDLEAPRLPGDVVLRAERDSLFERLGADLLLHAQNCVRRFGAFHLALSGGSTPMPFYLCLLTDPTFREMPWSETHLWVVDERRVGSDDDRSNFRHLRDYFVRGTDIPAEHAHDPVAEREDADIAYERSLRTALGEREEGQRRLDFVLLGMGADGHTASLFPGSPALRASSDRLVVMNDGPTVTPPARLTMTYRAINSARFIAVLVTGESKAGMIARVASGGAAAEELPIMGVHPMAGVQTWYLDAAAAGLGHETRAAQPRRSMWEGGSVGSSGGSCSGGGGCFGWCEVDSLRAALASGEGSNSSAGSAGAGGSTRGTSRVSFFGSRALRFRRGSGPLTLFGLMPPSQGMVELRSSSYPPVRNRLGKGAAIRLVRGGIRKVSGRGIPGFGGSRGSLRVCRG